MHKLTFIQTNDIHWRSANPRSRLDNYNCAMYDKVSEIFDIAAKNKADGILIAGDLVDTPGLSLNTISELAFLLSRTPCPIYAIAGQHDEWGHNPSSLSRTPFGLLRKLGFIHDVAEQSTELIIGAQRVIISGRHYDTEADIAIDYYEPAKLNFSDNPIIIHLAHGMVLDKTPGFELRHTLVSQLRTKASVVCVGDYHPGIGIQRNNSGAFIVNPGALGRLSTNASDLERQIQVSMIQVDETGHIDIRLLPITCAQPGHCVLSREHLEAEADRNERMGKFLGLLASEGESKFLEVRDIVEDIAARENIPEKVKVEALRRIDKAREELAKVGVI